MLREVVVAYLKTLSQRFPEWTAKNHESFSQNIRYLAIQSTRQGPEHETQALVRNHHIQSYTFVCVCVCVCVYALGFEMKTKDYFKEMSLYDIYLKFTESVWAHADG
jgi:hypothetical protein